MIVESIKKLWFKPEDIKIIMVMLTPITLALSLS